MTGEGYYTNNISLERMSIIGTPFISDHPRYVFSNVIQTALTRAIRYSSTFEAFNQERHYIKLMLLYNGYPSSFIDDQFRKFFFEYIGSSPFLPFINNEKQFFLMRHKIINQPTLRQSQVAMSVTNSHLDNDQTQEKQNESITKTANIETNKGDKLIVHYTHEKRFQPFKRDMHYVYGNVFKNTPAMNLKLIVGNRNRRDARNELVRKRPKPSILQNKRIKNKYLKILERRRQMKKTTSITVTTDYS